MSKKFVSKSFANFVHQNLFFFSWSNWSFNFKWPYIYKTAPLKPLSEQYWEDIVVFLVWKLLILTISSIFWVARNLQVTNLEIIQLKNNSREITDILFIFEQTKV